jgi:hypothetical protein
MTDIDRMYLISFLHDNRSAISINNIGNVKVVKIYSDILEPRIEVFRFLYEDGVRVLIKRKKTQDVNSSIFSPEFKDYYFLINEKLKFIDINDEVTSETELIIFLRKRKIKEIFNE